LISGWGNLAIDWQASLPVAVIILVKYQGQSNKHLLFDSRLWLLDKKSGKLLRQYNDLFQFLPISFRLAKELWLNQRKC
jgi:hypothetical protein